MLQTNQTSDKQKSRFFLTIEELNDYSSNEIIELKKNYDVTFEELDHSSFTGRYWTHFGEPIDHGKEAYRSQIRVETAHPQFVICRSIGTFNNNLTTIAESILQSPLTRIDIYDLTDVKSKIAKHRARHQQSLESDDSRERKAAQSVIISTHHVTYSFPELNLIERDYIQHLVHFLRQQIYEEQEEASVGMSLTGRKMPINQIIGRFVTGLELELVDDKYFLTFIYEIKHSKSTEINGREEKTKENEIPIELEIFADIPLDEDDEILENDENTLIIDGEPFIRFALTLQLDSPANPIQSTY